MYYLREKLLSVSILADTTYKNKRSNDNCFEHFLELYMHVKKYFNFLLEIINDLHEIKL